MNFMEIVGGVFTKYLQYILWAIFLSSVFVIAFNRALDEHSMFPFVEEFGIRLVSADQANAELANQITTDEPTGWFAKKAPWLYKPYLFISIFINGWFIYKMFFVFSYLIRKLFSLPEELGSMPVTVSTLYVMGSLHIIAVLYLHGPPETALGWVPFYGSWTAFKTIVLYVGGAL